MSEHDTRSLEAIEAELQQLRTMLKDPKVAGQLSAAIITKLAKGGTARDRLQAAKVASTMLEVGDPLRAGSLFQLLIEQDPAEPYYRSARGHAHLRAGEPQAALMRFDEAIGMDVNLAEAYMGRAEAHMALDHVAEAFADYEKVVALDPQSTFAQLALVMLSQRPRA
ncbi:MAG: tetratricopeptide repeat protein [Myxococcaceae bacterium]|nr:tetratricopeptide repeat protein [Myxococcaceae bacterium]